MSTGGTRPLIAAGEAAAGPAELPRDVRKLVKGAAAILVVSPVRDEFQLPVTVFEIDRAGQARD